MIGGNGFAGEKPDMVVFAAAKVGGIHANNTYPAEFIYDNALDRAHSYAAVFYRCTGF